MDLNKMLREFSIQPHYQPEPAPRSCGGKATPRELVGRLLERGLDFAWDDGEIHRATFSRNEFDIVTATYFQVHRNNDGSERLETLEAPLRVSTTADGRFLRLLGPSESPIGTYRHGFELRIPISRALAEGENAQAQGDLRWGKAQSVVVRLGAKS